MAETVNDSVRRRIGGGESSSVEAVIENLPEHIISNVLHKLDLESLCTAACVSRTFRSAVALTLSSLSSLDFSGFSLDEETLKHIARRVQGAKTITIDCLQVKNDSSIIDILGEHITDLSFLKCSYLSCNILRAIGERCPNLRSVLIEFVGFESSELFKWNLAKMLEKVSKLESLSIINQGTSLAVFHRLSLKLLLPRSMKALKFQLVDVRSFTRWIDGLRDIPWVKLQSLSLILDVISDELLITIVNSLPLLVELDLEDRACMRPIMPLDLTNTGLQRLNSCRHLVILSIVRRGIYLPSASFTRVDNMGMILLSAGCGGLESLKLGGFTKVTRTGFLSILLFCQNLKKFEVLNSSPLLDLTFHDMRGVSRSLIELRLISFSHLTSELMEELPSFSNLQVLDMSWCRSFGDSCLIVSYISSLTTLTTLNLDGTDITDDGLAILGRGNLPIARLCISGCKSVTDGGIGFLFHREAKICKTLLSLDVGNLPRMSDSAIFTIVSVAELLTDLCLRGCFRVTDAAIKMLVDRPNHKSSLLRRLDLYNCQSLSDDLIMELLRNSSLRGLRWLGIGNIGALKIRKRAIILINVRPWLMVCFDGCQLGCHDGWQRH